MLESRDLRAAALAHLCGRRRSWLGIRAEDVSLIVHGDARAPSPGRNRLAAKIVGLRALGALVTVEIDAGFLLKAYLLGPQARAMKLGVGDAVMVQFAVDALHIMTE